MSDHVAGDPALSVPEQAVDQRPPRASVARNLLDVASSQVVSFLLGLVAQIVQPRFVGPDGIGSIQLAFSIWLIAGTFIGFGTGSYLTLAMARDHKHGRALVGPVLLLRFALFGIASVGIALYAWAVGYETQILWLLAITGSTMLLTTVTETLTAAFTGLEQLKYPAGATIAAKFIYTIVMVVVLVAGGGVYGLALATSFNSALTVAILYLFYRRYGRITFGRPPEGFRLLVRGSVGFLIAGAVIVVYLQIDMVAMSLLVDEEQLGWYTVADVLMSSLLFIPSMLMSVLFPVIGRLHVEDTGAVDVMMRRALSTLALAGVAVGFGAAVVAEPFAVLLYGERFREAGDVLAVLGIAAPLMFLTMLLGTRAQATGRKRFWTTLMTLAIVLSIVFDIIFVPLMDRLADNGAIGGALGYVVTESMMVVVGIWKIAPRSWDRGAALRLAKIGLAGGLMVIAAWPLRMMFLPIPIAVGATVFIGAVLVLRILTPDEKQMLQRLVAKVRRGGPAVENVNT